MKLFGFCCFVVLGAGLAQADELHLRDGTIVIGTYVGGSQKEVYFQRTPAGADMYPLFMIESVKFNAVPQTVPNIVPGTSMAPGASLNNSPKPAPARVRDLVAARLQWAFALLFPPSLTADLAHSAH